jgi:hypothetical protein
MTLPPVPLPCFTHYDYVPVFTGLQAAAWRPEGAVHVQAACGHWEGQQRQEMPCICQSCQPGEDQVEERAHVGGRVKALMSPVHLHSHESLEHTEHNTH